MDEQEKPFDTISIIVLLSLAVANDGAEIFFDVLASTMVGLPGESIMKPIDFAMDGIFTFWFFSKCGFGGPAIIQVADDLLELVGIPGRFICVAASIFMANHPKLAAVAEMAGAAALTGGRGDQIDNDWVRGEPRTLAVGGLQAIPIVFNKNAGWQFRQNGQRRSLAGFARSSGQGGAR